MPDVELVLVDPQPRAMYSGMVPGWLAGHHSVDDLSIDLQVLAKAAGARWLPTAVVGLDADRRRLTLADGSTLDGDVLSLNIGSTLIPPAAAPNGRLLSLRPLSALVTAWPQLLADPWLREDASPLAVTMVGGGAAGVESLLAVCARLRSELPQRPLLPRLITRSAGLLPAMAPRAGRLTAEAMVAAGVQLQFATDARQVLGQPGPYPGLLLWAAGAQAHDWPRHSGLSCNEQGFVRIDAQLRSRSHPGIFAVGDGCSFEPALPKAGVYAVRMGPVLAENLRAALSGGQTQAYRPQRRYLALLTLSDGRAVAVRGDWALSGRWAQRWKDHIDRRFVSRFQLTAPSA